jgi:hypothetical protein
MTGQLSRWAYMAAGMMDIMAAGIGTEAVIYL